jgi:hypothetical protein
MKARKVPGLPRDGTLADNLERIVQVRLDELVQLGQAALDPRDITALHDLRIAAKRLRYILELTPQPCFGAYAQVGVKRARELQELLGEIHDCDVQLPRVRRLAAELRAADVIEARQRAGTADDLDPTHAFQTAHADSWRGLKSLDVYLQARRGLLYERFVVRWTELEREGFAARLRYAVSERVAADAHGGAADARSGHAATLRSQNGDHRAAGRDVAFGGTA